MNFEEIKAAIREWLEAQSRDADFYSENNFVLQNVGDVIVAHYKGPIIVGAMNREFTFNSHDFVELTTIYNGNQINLIIPFSYIASQEEFVSIGKPDGKLYKSFELYKYIASKLTDRHHQSVEARFISDLIRNNEENRHYTVREVIQIKENLRAHIQALGNEFN
ncbi:hypothetical protein FY524_12760 [Acinetobacter baumannii]|uniref:hypothetical protein n=1 Tax=Acinetobacter baumannii TaxID=470 RepID=UPI000B964DEA|nr:hypothetical protein [Acinetobacter baumannii]MBF6763322.1 hypothetical protein [Acinetobacter baumannii]MBF6945480.1 hypothetical protein [Acinetobacter baumannii]MCC0746485.1 hypothetical protein [Acinetobacter baumannii]OYN91924.1 hypothetical protein CEX94_09910 [Acinetobacter baumannii]TYR48095.1 hypothetical protein FY524_12760 [Acinetobacter baumannii]